MKRVLLSVTGTVLGVVALLSFKSSGHPLTATGALPSAALPGAGVSTSAPQSSASAAAPPDPAGGPTAASSGATAGATATSGATAGGTFLGSAITTRYGIVQVKVTVADQKITNVSFAQLTAFDGRSQQINSDAAPILLQETLTAQSAQIDSVSGASYTSQGYAESLQSALDAAGYK